MAARSRPRAGMTKEDPADAHEERNMWNQIVNDLKRLKVIHARATEVSNAIVEMEAKFDGSQYDHFCSTFYSAARICFPVSYSLLLNILPRPALDLSKYSHVYFCRIQEFFVQTENPSLSRYLNFIIKYA